MPLIKEHRFQSYSVRQVHPYVIHTDTSEVITGKINVTQCQTTLVI